VEVALEDPSTSKNQASVMEIMQGVLTYKSKIKGEASKLFVELSIM
jgi:hypothetical protein